jgi:hypothetical protein
MQATTSSRGITAQLRTNGAGRNSRIGTKVTTEVAFGGRTVSE